MTGRLYAGDNSVRYFSRGQRRGRHQAS